MIPSHQLLRVTSFFQNYPSNLAILVTALRASIQLFGEKDPQTLQFRQQDASEAFSAILNFLSREINLDDIFQIHFLTQMIAFSGNPIVSQEQDDRLRCFIDADTKYLEQGILLQSEIESGGQVLLQKKEISQLPKILTIQMMRFTYRNDEKITAKIVRRVTQPARIDASQWTTADLKQELLARRETYPDAGFYKLKAIITHRGRSADSGHYVSHVCVQDHWIRYDDEKVKEIEDDDVDRLSGSADWHCSFILFYEAL